ncbi:hypothetical protein CVT24_003050 [Panaeolus cyanescens]|uniref:Uncharacterized protein n=1 Tax=Panaeolus cyanescens TaxID=181874 RepID=A0A409W8R2_9AGAR|nr:hypothetical protein CVT24_003050 [Panaeolus cyanescens]
MYIKPVFEGSNSSILFQFKAALPMSGLFFVYCETGPKVDDADFNEWYDDVHIPDLFTLPGFLNSQRYTATDSRTPHYLGTFTVDTPDPTSMIHSDQFKALVDAASPREKYILNNIETVNRRDLELIFEHPPSYSAPSGEVAKYLFVVTLDFLDDDPSFQEDANRWYNEEHIPDIAKVNGWTRSRRFKLNESVELNLNTDSTVHQNVPKYLALHEFTNDQYMADPAMLAAIQDEKGQSLLPKMKLDLRHFVLHRAWFSEEHKFTSSIALDLIAGAVMASYWWTTGITPEGNIRRLFILQGIVFFSFMLLSNITSTILLMNSFRGFDGIPFMTTLLIPNMLTFLFQDGSFVLTATDAENYLFSILQLRRTASPNRDQELHRISKQVGRAFPHTGTIELVTHIDVEEGRDSVDIISPVSVVVVEDLPLDDEEEL